MPQALKRLAWTSDIPYRDGDVRGISRWNTDDGRPSRYGWVCPRPNFDGANYIGAGGSQQQWAIEWLAACRRDWPAGR